MLIAITAVATIGAACGIGLGIAARRFHVEVGRDVEAIRAMMPGSQCGQCGFAGCAAAADAIAAGEAPPNCCPPGGKTLALALAEKLGIALDGASLADDLPAQATVNEALCIGCTKCYKACPTDAILGSVRQVHAVLGEACSGCGSCQALCPTGAIALAPPAPTPQNWVWPHPARAFAANANATTTHNAAATA